VRIFSDLSSRHRAWLIGIIALGLIARVVWMFAMPYFVPVTQQADPSEYNQLAKNLASGEGYRFVGIKEHPMTNLGERLKTPTARRPPLYPLLISLVYSLFGERYRIIFLLQCLFDVVTMLAAFAIASRLFQRAEVALLAAGFVACYPPFFQQNIVLMSESLGTVLMTLFFLALIVALSNNRVWLFALSGLLLGSCALVRPDALALSVAIPIVLLFVLRKGKQSWRRAVWSSLAILVCFWLAISPWVIRNAVVLGRFIPGTTLTGRVMLTGLYMSTVDPKLGIAPLMPPEVIARVKDLDDISKNDVLVREAVKYALKNPLVWLSGAPGKINKMWLNATDWSSRYFLYYPTTSRNHNVNYALLFPNLFLLFFAFIAVFRYKGRWRRQAVPIFVAVVVLTLAETFLEAAGRHSMKLMPAIMVLAAYGLYMTLKSDPKEEPAARKKLWLWVATLSLPVVLFLCGEAVLRIGPWEIEPALRLDYETFVAGNLDHKGAFKYIYQRDNDLFWKGRPNTNWTGVVGRDIPVSMNSRGFRGPEFTAEKPASTFRIASLGDSRTFGLGVSDEDSYSQKLERLLDEQCQGDRDVEVLNLGIMGYTLFQGWISLNLHAPQFQPDVVTFAFGFNDVLPAEHPDSVYYANGHSWLGRCKEFLRNSRVFLLYEKLLLRAGRLFSQEPPPRVIENSEQMCEEFGTVQLGGMVVKDHRVGETEYRELLAKSVEFCKSRGITPLVIILPQKSLKPPYVKVPKYHGLMVSFCEEHRVPFVDMFPAFFEFTNSGPEEDALDRQKRLLCSICHPTAFGHSLIAREIAKKLAALKLLPCERPQ